MSLHSLLPLLALLLNVSLVGVSLVRNPASRLNRVFAYFVSGMALWNFGVFMLRRAPDAPSAYFWEVVIFIGVIMLPAFYYHFVLIFLEATTRHRPTLVLAYAISFFFTAFNISGSPLFMKGVTWTYWGWGPTPGPLFYAWLLSFNFYIIYGLRHLMKAYTGVDSSFRRNRATLIVLGTFVSLSGGFIDLTRTILAKFFPTADQIYPVGIPANTIFALMLGISIVRYRLFDVNVAVKKVAIYSLLGAAITAALAFVTWATEQYFDMEGVSAVWVIGPVGLLITLLLTPLGQRLEVSIERLMFSRRRGCYETLLDLSKRMSGILDFGRLVDTLVHGLVRGIPVTHCVLMTHDAPTNSFIAYREEATLDENLDVPAIRGDSPIVQWLTETESVLVKEEAKLNPKIARYFEMAEAELDEIKASLIAPLKIENKLSGILLLGEKLSGEIFDSQELEVLTVLANQAAVSLENARLYEGLSISNARLKEASRLKSQFLANMSHELRTPLNSVIGFSKVLLNRLDGDLTERQEAYIRSVHHSSTHLLELITGILDFSRIESGKLEMRLEDVDLPDLVDECIESSVPLVKEKRLKLEKDLPLELPRARADRTKLKQVLLNLISNAIKFTAAGRVVVRVRHEGDALHVSVADTGIGIPDADLPRLFEPFERLDSQVATQAGGTGLGLTISKRFVELHGGRVWAESRVNQGSTFHFTLPLAPVAAQS
ncbi:MAG: GAF domain-containing protein [Candidatus Rokubacteria bacterium]|nr:GAF domain-containing protein [Candidatus Rokubacteria bacterium]